MRECLVCGDNDYQEIAGHFYCTTCNTQSQSTRVEVNEAEFEDYGTHFTQIKEKKSDTKDKRQKKEKVEEKGDPWSIYEAYQLIMQHQVEALIQLGAKPELKDIVFKIWANYLSRLGVAFSDKGIAEPLSKRNRQREMFPGTTKSPKVRNVLGRSKRRKTVGVSSKTIEKETEKQQMAEALQAAEGESEDSSEEEEGKKKKRKRKKRQDVFEFDADEGDDDEDAADEVMDQNLDVDGARLDVLDNTRRRGLQGDSCYKMQMLYTLSFCYLGLMATNPLTTCVDIIRWVSQEKIPYVDVKDLLSSKMKFCLHDWKLFGEGVVPDLTRLRMRTSSLGRFLDFSDSPCLRFPQDDLLIKYILMLDLPGECNQMVRTLYHRLVTPKPQKFFNLFFWEGTAMALIIILLKMVFGIDDKSERLFSTFSKDLNTELYEGELKVFVWDKWIGHVAKKINLLNMQDNKQSNEAQRLDQRTKSTKLSDIKLKLYKNETREKIRQPLDELSERMRSKSRKKQLGSSSQSLSGSEDERDGLNMTQDTLVADDPDLEYILNKINDGLPGQENTNQMNTKAQNKILKAGEVFRCCTMQHLVNPVKFLSQHGIDVGSCDSDLESDGDNISDSESDLDSSDEDRQSKQSSKTLSEKSSKKSHKSPTKSPSNKPSKSPSKSPKKSQKSPSKSNVESSKLNSAKCLMITTQVQFIKAHYRIAVKSDKSLSHSSSYNWLLQLASKFLYCKPRELQQEIDKLEANLMPTEIQKQMADRRKSKK